MKRENFLAVRLSKVEKTKLADLARQWGCPQSDVIRWALRRELMDHDRPGPAPACEAMAR